MVTITKVFGYLIPIVLLVVIVIILFGGEGMIGKVKEVILGAKDVLKDFLPDVSLGLKEQKADVTIPDAHRAEILTLIVTINRMLKPENENCFANFGGFSDFGEEKGGTSLIFGLRGEKTALIVTSGKQKIDDLSVEFTGMKPCVIAGEGEVSKNFVSHFIEGKELIYPYFNEEVNSLIIWYGTSGYKGNRISVGEFDSDTVNDESDNFESNGWLFTPDGQHICFFPTNKVVDYDQDGIEKGYFTLGAENSLQNKINLGDICK